MRFDEHARQKLSENRRKLFPIRLVDFDAIQAWECFDADLGEDLAVEIREYFIPDFSNWKHHDPFEAAWTAYSTTLKPTCRPTPPNGRLGWLEAGSLGEHHR